MKLNPNETELIGRWIDEGDRVRGDATCERVQWLTSHHLRKVAVSKQWGAWETLFQDPADGRYWEQTYPEGHMQGGGPPALKWISAELAKAKYGDEVGRVTD